MLVYFRDLGSKGKILLGRQGNYFQGSGEINALFSGIKGAQTPPGGPHQFLSKSSLHRSVLHFQVIFELHSDLHFYLYLEVSNCINP